MIVPQNIRDLTAEQYAIYEQGFEDGANHAINVAFQKAPPYRDYDTPEERCLYDWGRDDGFNSID